MKFPAIIVNMYAFFMQNFLLEFLLFILESNTSVLHFWVDFLYVALVSEIKCVALRDCERKEIKAFVAEWLRCQATNLEVGVRSPLR